MRWILLAVTALLFILSLNSSSPGWMALGLLTGLVLSFVTVIAFAAKRIEAGANRDFYTPSAEEIELLRRRQAESADLERD